METVDIFMSLQHVTQNHQYFATNIVRENSVPTTSSQFMSPYAVLPPVGSAREVQHYFLN